MVKRRQEEQIAGVLEFEGLASDDSEFKGWLAEHKTRNGGPVRVSRGARGVRVMFSKAADMALWKKRADEADKGKRSQAS